MTSKDMAARMNVAVRTPLRQLELSCGGKMSGWEEKKGREGRYCRVLRQKKVSGNRE